MRTPLLGVAALCLLLAQPVHARAQDASAAASASAAPVAAAPASVLHSAAPHAPIPYKQDKAGSDHLPFQSLAALILTALAAYGVVLFLKKSRLAQGGKLGRARRSSLLETTRLSRRSQLHVVQFHGSQLLLVETAEGVSLLSSHPGTEASDA